MDEVGKHLDSQHMPCVINWGGKCVTCSYHDKCTPYHSQMNVIQTTLLKKMIEKCVLVDKCTNQKTDLEEEYSRIEGNQNSLFTLNIG